MPAGVGQTQREHERGCATGGEWHSCRQTTKMMDPGSESGQYQTGSASSWKGDSERQACWGGGSTGRAPLWKAIVRAGARDLLLDKRTGQTPVRVENSDGDQVRLPGGRDVTRSATQLLRLLEEALVAVETLCESNLRAKGETSETRSGYGIGASAGRGTDGCGIVYGSDLRAMGKTPKTRGDGGTGASAKRGVDGCRRCATGQTPELLRPLLEDATMTASADVEGCGSELSRSVRCRKGFLKEPD